MRISVVTVCFNSAATIGHTLESFFAQEHPDKELVIVDGASTDGTLDLVRRRPQAQIKLISERDAGIYDAMNKGLVHFSGDAVGFLNSDDRFHDPRVLSDIAAALSAADMVYGDLDFVTDHESAKVVRRWRSTPYRPGAFRAGWMAAHPSFYVRRRVVEAVGDFDLRYKISSDYDWMLRAFELNDFSARLLRRPIIDMQVGGNSTRSLQAYVKGNLEALQSRRRWLSAAAVDLAFFAKPLGKVTQFITPPS
jgi:glycosyltransferase involved in cell wall biosynthesis